MGALARAELAYPLSMHTSSSFSDLPQAPGVYALFGGRGSGRHVAYVGIGSKVRTRVHQHLVLRNSSVTTGQSVVSLDPELVSEVCWWCRARFEEPGALEAAEQVAFDVLRPTLRSRGRLKGEAEKHLGSASFRRTMVKVFEGEPDGRLLVPTISDALDRLAELEDRVRELEAAVRKLGARR